MNLGRIFLSLIFLMIFGEIRAQEKIKEVEALNLYTEYANEASHTMSLIYKELESFNRQAYDQIGKSKVQLSYKNRNVKDIRSAYLLPVDLLLKKSIARNKVLHKNEQQQLHQIADSLFMSVNTMCLYRDTLINYTQKKLYKKDENLQLAFSLMNKSEKVFTIFNRHFLQFEDELLKVYQNYKYSDRSNPFVRLTSSVQPSIESTRKVLLAAQENEYLKLDEAHDELFKNISELIDRKAYNLSGMTSGSTNSNGLEPEHIYGNFIAEVSEFYKITQSFLSKRNVENDWKGRGYDFYNGEFLDRYNRYGGGVVYAYNQMIEEANVSLLKQLEAPNVFRVFPPIEEEDVEIHADELLSEKEEEEKDTAIVVDETKNNKPKAETKEQLKAKIGTPTLKGFQSNNLILLLDVSASMNKPEKLPILKESVIHLLSLMRPQDYVSIVVYSGKAKTVLPPTSAQNKQKVIRVINELKSGGGTNVIKGMSKSLKIATDNYIENGNNRIILATDGGFEMSKSLFRKAEQISRRNMSLSIFYLNKKELSTFAAKFKELANKGNGNYTYVTKQNAKVVLLKEAQSIQK